MCSTMTFRSGRLLDAGGPQDLVLEFKHHGAAKATSIKRYPICWKNAEREVNFSSRALPRAGSSRCRLRLFWRQPPCKRPGFGRTGLVTLHLLAPKLPVLRG